MRLILDDPTERDEFNWLVKQAMNHGIELELDDSDEGTFSDGDGDGDS